MPAELAAALSHELAVSPDLRLERPIAGDLPTIRCPDQLGRDLVAGQGRGGGAVVDASGRRSKGIRTSRLDATRRNRPGLHRT